jgi:hypothetical protein
MSNQTITLSMADLETHDPHGGKGAGENRRWKCPVCAGDKRTLSAQPESGLWNCFRCEAQGKLTDKWERSIDRDRVPARRQRASAQRARLSELREIEPQSVDHEWRARLAGLVALQNTPGADYLQSRAISIETARAAGVRYCSNWFGRSAVVFPVRDRALDLVAGQGRQINGSGKITVGPKSRGVFVAPVCVADRTFGPLDQHGPGVIVCEAPIDALSLAECGFPALALCGINGEATTGPAWLRLACGLKSVYLAFDADEAGDSAARAMAAHLGAYGANCATLRPEGAKDWNEMLQARGRDELSDWIAAQVLMNEGAD